MRTTEVEELDLNEDEIKLRLMDSDVERNDALGVLYELLSEKLLSYLERSFPGLPSDLAANAMVDAFRALNEKVIEGTFKYDHSVVGFLFGVGWNKGVDELRKFTCRALGNSDFFEWVGESLANTEIGRLHTQHVGQERADEIAQEFRDFLLTLPPVQRQVAQVIADNLPTDVSEEAICSEVLRRTEKRMTVVQVKSAKREIRKKFRAILYQ
jgi:DNA-directed RNA polymerase specialized sigma24 family protein